MQWCKKCVLPMAQQSLSRLMIRVCALLAGFTSKKNISIGIDVSTSFWKKLKSIGSHQVMNA